MPVVRGSHRREQREPPPTATEDTAAPMSHFPRNWEVLQPATGAHGHTGRGPQRVAGFGVSGSVRVQIGMKQGRLWCNACPRYPLLPVSVEIGEPRCGARSFEERHHERSESGAGCHQCVGRVGIFVSIRVKVYIALDHKLRETFCGELSKVVRTWYSQRELMHAGRDGFGGISSYAVRNGGIGRSAAFLDDAPSETRTPSGEDNSSSISRDLPFFSGASHTAF